ncbi:MAG: helix-turn-helix domain-containing protein [Bacteroidota bacterium]
MNVLNLKDQLNHIEQLHLATKEVLTLEEACEYGYIGNSQGYIFKLTCAGKIPVSKPREKLIYFEKKQFGKS